MKAIVLAAGYATRLYPLTLNKPKSLLEVAGKPVLNYIIEKLDEVESIDEIFIITNDKFYMNFIYWLEQYKDNFVKKIEILNDNTTSDENKLGAIGDLFFAIKEKNIQDNILVISGDNIFDFSLKGIAEFFLQKGKTTNGILELENKEEGKRYGIVELEDNKIVDFEEKPENPKTNLRSISIYLYTKSDLKKIEQYIKTDKPKDAPGYLIQYLHKIQDVYGFLLKGKTFDIGNLESYKKANEVLGKMTSPMG